MSSKKDIDILETTEWLEAINSVIEEEGIERASFLLTKLAERINQEGAIPSYNLTTPFRNTISVKDEAQMPGDLFMERRIRSLIRWNALVMVLKANKNDDELGGHISTFHQLLHSMMWALIIFLEAQIIILKIWFIIKDIVRQVFMQEVFLKDISLKKILIILEERS